MVKIHKMTPAIRSDIRTAYATNTQYRPIQKHYHIGRRTAQMAVRGARSAGRFKREMISAIASGT